ncbi:MAG: hypothetical protein P8O70_19815 [SAR324 cluster bacterium]|nr:hypothetical protein [SAR324 cluster bacterium]
MSQPNQLQQAVRRKLSLQGRRIGLEGVWYEIVREGMAAETTKLSGTDTTRLLSRSRSR